MTDWATLDSRMDAAAFRTMGQDAQYTANGEVVSETVRVIATPQARRIGEGGFFTLRSELQVQKTQVAIPRKGDRYALAGQTWLVDDYEPMGGRWALIVRPVTA